ncbi:hypothetical protein QQS21_006743 [Conoideocrella luteorostrata]|uniref:Acyl-coenzyme A oxidase n=1 Tax=Conoideocrella luteorostrata TaxID=1105319 RepID=A0AAJ0CM85_9HYPO|nr:hypothetical protein QQS21_006743 [Conoideocrella luteorostrata]
MDKYPPAKPTTSANDAVSTHQMAVMGHARFKTKFDIEILASIIHGSTAKVQQRREAWRRVEAAMGTNDTSRLPIQYALTSREDKYQDGLRMSGLTLNDCLRYKHDCFEYITPRYALCNNSPFGMTVMFIKAVEIMGTPEQQQKWVRPMLDGEMTGAYAQTELGHGSYVAGIETTATFDAVGDCFVIHSPSLTSTKFWPGALGLSASHAIVLARLCTNGQDHGIHAFVVQLRDLDTWKPIVGIQLGDIGSMPAYNEIDNGYALFDNIRVPREHMLMGYATVSRDGTYEKRTNAVHTKAIYACITYSRAKVAWVSAIQLAATLTIAIRYCTVRSQGVWSSDDVPKDEVPLMAYRSQNYRLMKHLAEAYAMIFASHYSNEMADDFKRRQSQGDFSTMARTHAITAGIKAWATSKGSEAAEDARKCCGGVGCLDMSGLPDRVQSISILCTLEGDNFVLYQQVARYIIKWTRRVMKNKPADLPPELHYIAVPRGQTCSAKGPEFLQSDTLLLLFEYRARTLAILATERLNNAVTSDGKGPSHAWNEHVMLLISAAKAHVELVVLEAFVAKIASIADAQVHRVMQHLCCLFSLTSIMEATAADAALWFESGFLHSSHIRDIEREVNALLEGLLDSAIGLTDAWDFTDTGLASAIGMKNGNIYETLMTWIRQLPINNCNGCTTSETGKISKLGGDPSVWLKSPRRRWLRSVL